MSTQAEGNGRIALIISQRPMRVNKIVVGCIQSQQLSKIVKDNPSISFSKSCALSNLTILEGKQMNLALFIYFSKSY